jgi:hypothetical protein
MRDSARQPLAHQPAIEDGLTLRHVTLPIRCHTMRVRRAKMP